MKTRKVGRVLSLLLAFVLVAGIMVPASSVLAEESKYKGVTWTTVGDFKDLDAKLDLAPTDGTVLYLQLGQNIQAPQFTTQENPGNIDQGPEVKSPYVTFKETWVTFSTIKKYLGLKNYTLSELKNTGFFNSEYFSDLDSTKHPVDDGIKIRLTEKNREGLLATDDNKVFEEYDYDRLIVRANTNVVIDLNEKTIKGLDSGAIYSGGQTFQSSVFTVKGSLTITDLDSDNDGVVGKITGGTGTPIDWDSGSRDNNLDDSEEVYFFDAWTNPTGFPSDGWNIFNPPDHVLKYDARSHWYYNAKGVAGGGVYVDRGGKLYLENGKITSNSAWVASNEGIFASGIDSKAYGAGVYVAQNGYFSMTGGEISNNVARAYQKEDSARNTYSYGGGVYLAGYAKMDFTGGKVVDNATYGEVYVPDGERLKSVYSEGGGIYVSTNATLNMMGAAEASGATTDAMRATFPQVSGNTCGGIARNGVTGGVHVRGAGVYSSGNVNIRKAVISANDFSEFAPSMSSGRSHKVGDSYIEDTALIFGTDKQIVPAGRDMVKVVRDPVTGLADTDTPDGSPVETEIVAQETSGNYSVGRATADNSIDSEGAGIYFSGNGSLVVGERTWIYDNWDLVTNGHKDYENNRYNERYWDKTDGRYEYKSSYNASSNGVWWEWKKAGNKTNGVGSAFEYDVYYKSYKNDGYVWSDTRDDVYLGQVMYIGEDLFECKIGINYNNMTGAPESTGSGNASNRVFVKVKTNLDKTVWGDTTYVPSPRDIQFFFLNDNNKDWEESYPIAASNAGVPFEAGGTASNPKPPQISSEIDADDKLLPLTSSGTLKYDKNRYMNYKAFWDNGDTTRPDWPKDTSNYALGTKEAPVLRFAEVDRNSYMTFEYGTDSVKFGKLKSDETNYFFGQEMNPLMLISGFSTDYTKNNNIDYFKDMNIRILGADYENYKPGVLDTIEVGAKTSITKDGDAEAEDLYFKGWTFYTSYGYGPVNVYPGYGQVDNFYSTKINSASRAESQTILNDDKTLFNITRSTFTIDDDKINNPNINAGICPSFTANWYTQEELNEARKNISNVMVQRVSLSSQPGKLYLRFIALVGPDYVNYDEAGFVFSTEKEEVVDGVKVKVGSATPTIEGGYDFSVKSKIYKRIWTINAQYPNGAWLNIGTLLGLKNPASNDVNVRWSFTEDSVFDASEIKLDNTSLGINAGLLYTNVEVPNTDEGKNTVYYATPYYKDSTGYHYGESRAVTYQWILDKDQAAGL